MWLELLELLLSFSERAYNIAWLLMVGHPVWGLKVDKIYKVKFYLQLIFNTTPFLKQPTPKSIKTGNRRNIEGALQN